MAAANLVDFKTNLTLGQSLVKEKFFVPTVGLSQSFTRSHN